MEFFTNARIRGFRIIHDVFNVSSSAAYETARNRLKFNVFICHAYN